MRAPWVTFPSVEIENPQVCGAAETDSSPAPAASFLSPSETGRTISVHVKTGTTSVFRLSNTDEQVGPATAQWYVLVRLGGVGSRPDFYVVPALVIAALVYVDHRRWLEEPSSRTGEPRKDTAIRA